MVWPERRIDHFWTIQVSVIVNPVDTYQLAWLAIIIFVDAKDSAIYKEGLYGISLFISSWFL